MQKLTKITTGIWIASLTLILFLIILIIIIFTFRIEVFFQTQVIFKDNQNYYLVVSSPIGYRIKDQQTLLLKVTQKHFLVTVLETTFDPEEQNFHIFFAFNYAEKALDLIPNSTIDAIVIYDYQSVFQTIFTRN